MGTAPQNPTKKYNANDERGATGRHPRLLLPLSMQQQQGLSTKRQPQCFLPPRAHSSLLASDEMHDLDGGAGLGGPSQAQVGRRLQRVASSGSTASCLSPSACLGTGAGRVAPGPTAIQPPIIC